MNLKGLLPQDVEGLHEWLEEKRREYHLDLAETFLLRHSVCRIAANEIRAQAHRKASDGWWDPFPKEYELTHIVDWLVADLRDGAPWLGNLDERNRPKKLLKCSSYEDLIREADKAMDRRNAQDAKALRSDDEEHVDDLGGGYTLVRMLTPEALDLESRRMHHCIGHGSYDGKLKSGWDRYLSVRDHRHRPAATMELRRESNGRWSIRQIAGKHNSRPLRGVMDVIRAYSVAQDWLDREFFWPVVLATDGAFHDVDRIPAGMTLRGDLSVSDDVIDTLGLFDLPPDLTVLGDVTLSARLRIPERMTVCGVLEINSDRLFVPDDDNDIGVRFPESLHVDREIRIHKEDIARPIPTHLYPITKVYQRKLTGQRLESLQWLETVEGIDEDQPSPRM